MNFIIIKIVYGIIHSQEFLPHKCTVYCHVALSVFPIRPIGLCGCLKLAALVLPMIVALTTVLYALAYRDTLWPAVPSCKWIMLNCFITRGPTTCLCTGALSTLATPLIWNDLVILFLWPVVSMPQTEKTLSTYAWLAGADIMSSATSDSLS